MSIEDPYARRIKELMERIALLEQAIELQQSRRLDAAHAELARLRSERDALWEQHESWWEQRRGRVVSVAEVLPEVLLGLKADIS